MPDNRSPSTGRTPDLVAFERMKVVVAFHFSMNTFTGNDYDQGTEPATMYDPTTLDVDQWLASAERGSADRRLLFNSLGMCKMRMPQNARRQPFFNIALLVDRWCSDTACYTLQRYMPSLEPVDNSLAFPLNFRNLFGSVDLLTGLYEKV